MTSTEALNTIKVLIPDGSKRGIKPATFRQAFQVITDIISANEAVEVQLITALQFPLKKGFVIVKEDTSFSETPKIQLFYNDGTAANKDDLYTWPIQQLKDLI